MSAAFIAMYPRMICRIPASVISAISTLAMIGGRSRRIYALTIGFDFFAVLSLDLYGRLKLKRYPLGSA